jgi:hypothetical protein
MPRRIERDEEQRAYAAYFRFAKGHPVDQLAAALSGMAKYKGLEYVAGTARARWRSTASRTTATSTG